MDRLRSLRGALIVLVHAVLASVAYLGAFALAYEFTIPNDGLDRFVRTLPYALALRMAAFHQFGLFRGYWQHVGLRDLVNLTTAVTASSVGLAGVLLVLGILVELPPTIVVLDWLLVMALAGGARFAARWARERRRSTTVDGARTLIIGAGAAGEQLLRQIQHDQKQALQVVGLVDDDPEKRGRSLHGVPVLGGADELRGLVRLHRIERLLIAVPTATLEQRRRLVDRCTETGVELKILPPLQDMMTADVQMSELRDVQIEDLLGREPVTLDVTAVAADLAGKVVLVTGAGGSIGAELVRQIARFNPLRLILVERAESPLYFIHLEVSQAHPAVHVVPVLASVTNAERLEQVFATYQPDYVFHAAAYKHVPLLEMHAVEGVWNNVAGTLRMAKVSARYGVQKFVLISTDKAVNPTCILGATKRVAEQIVLDLPSLRSSTTDFRVVRFGNVLGSDGSVVPLFKRQLAAGGPLTVTHPEVRRYFMTIPEAVQLVLAAAALPEAAGRISLLEMGRQVRIVDLAEQLIRLSGLVPHQDVQITFTGLRPGEKLAEELLAHSEAAEATSLDKIRVVARNGAHGDVLAQRIRTLLAAAARWDEEALGRALSALVPEYAPASLELVLGRNGRRHAEYRRGSPARHRSLGAA